MATTGAAEGAEFPAVPGPGVARVAPATADEAVSASGPPVAEKTTASPKVSTWRSAVAIQYPGPLGVGARPSAATDQNPGKAGTGGDGGSGAGAGGASGAPIASATRWRISGSRS